MLLSGTVPTINRAQKSPGASKLFVHSLVFVSLSLPADDGHVSSYLSLRRCAERDVTLAATSSTCGRARRVRQTAVENLPGSPLKDWPRSTPIGHNLTPKVLVVVMERRASAWTATLALASTTRLLHVGYRCRSVRSMTASPGDGVARSLFRGLRPIWCMSPSRGRSSSRVIPAATATTQTTQTSAKTPPTPAPFLLPGVARIRKYLRHRIQACPVPPVSEFSTPIPSRRDRVAALFASSPVCGLRGSLCLRVPAETARSKIFLSGPPPRLYPRSTDLPEVYQWNQALLPPQLGVTW